MKWDTTKTELEKKTNESIKKYRLDTLGLTFKLRLAMRRMKAKKSKCERQWQTLLSQAGICGKCLNHTCRILAMLLLFSPLAQADMNQNQAVKAIIGEAANQGLEGMTAVAEVIRNRGHLKGLYGMKRESFISSQPTWVHKQAMKAWLMSKESNLTKGATHFENIKAFGSPRWAKKMVKTAVIKDHVFFRGNK